MATTTTHKTFKDYFDRPKRRNLLRSLQSDGVEDDQAINRPTPLHMLPPLRACDVGGSCFATCINSAASSRRCVAAGGGGGGGCAPGRGGRDRCAVERRLAEGHHGPGFAPRRRHHGGADSMRLVSLGGSYRSRAAFVWASARSLMILWLVPATAADENAWNRTGRIAGAGEEPRSKLGGLV
ncbi:hypothetical protein GQ55_7G225300 [Panicum hallii var. hallii]|uniref:Uncharacterized protein n=1 Tax=Panicum hallii var. hallii TaxID=1504633 RepID=A0A2T7CY68_9POAL|nr:hypothetical protein GQ55_7G225300 [Panicum hallii var. hallii]